jgi:glutathione S-transferase
LTDRSYVFTPIDIFSAKDRQRVKSLSPILKIPLLIDGHQIIWDSLLIYKYLTATVMPLSLEKEIVLINELTDACIQIYQLRKFAVDPDDQKQFSLNHLERIQQLLTYFDQSFQKNKLGEQKEIQAENALIKDWLFCTLDWVSFRNVIEWKKHYPHLCDFYLLLKDDPRLTTTAPQ